MSVKRVNLTLNADNPMDSLIIELLGGEDYLTSKNIKGLLLQIAINNGTFTTQKRNVSDTKKKLKSDNKVTNKKQGSVKKVSKIEQEGIDNVTNDFDLDDLISVEEVSNNEDNKKALSDEDIYKSMLNFM